MSGSVATPFGIRVSPLLRHQAGQNYARLISVGSAAATAAGAIYASTTANPFAVEPLNSRRQDNITVFDLRADRGFTVYRNLRVRLIGDLFNITNSNAVETRTVTTGTAFNRPTAVLAPRTARIGVRVTF